MKDSERKYYQSLSDTCIAAMTLSKEEPGRYGGRYIFRDSKEAYIIHKDDDPEALTEEEKDMVWAHCQADTTHAVGGYSKYYLNEDGTIDWDWLEENF